MVELLPFVLLGILAGTLGALVGLGGGLVVVPVLTLFFDVPIRTAVACGLICVVATSTSAASHYVRQGLADTRIGMILETGAVLGALTGASLVIWMSRTALQIIFGTILFAAAILLEYHRPRHEIEQFASNDYSPRNLGTGAAVSYVTGSVSGILGIGGGPIQVPLLYLILGVPMKVATATSNYIMGVTGTAGAMIYYLRGDIDILVTTPVVLGILAGAQVGSRLLVHLRSTWIQRILTLTLIYLGALMWLDAFQAAIPWSR